MNNKMNHPLITVDGRTLMDHPLEPPNFVVDTLISQGLHILAAPRKWASPGFALWLAVTVAKGEPVWNMTTKQGTTSISAWRDSVLRIQNRLFEITEDAPDSVHFCTECALIGQGLEEQVDAFVAAHPTPCWSSSTPCRWSVRSMTPPTPMTTGICLYSSGWRTSTALPSCSSTICGKKRQRMCSTGSPGPPPSAALWIPASPWWKKSGGSGRTRLTCVGRDIEYRELELRRGEENVGSWFQTAEKNPCFMGIGSSFFSLHL